MIFMIHRETFETSVRDVKLSLCMIKLAFGD